MKRIRKIVLMMWMAVWLSACQPPTTPPPPMMGPPAGQGPELIKTWNGPIESSAGQVHC